MTSDSPHSPGNDSLGSHLHVLLAGPAEGEALEQARSILLAHPDVDLVVQPTGNGHADPLAAASRRPDLLVLVLGSAWQAQLEALAEQAPTARPPILVIGAQDDMLMLRKAMQVGARDCLGLPLSADELNTCLRQIAQEIGNKAVGQSCVTAVVNAKGGSGASFIAASLAHMLAAHWQYRTALIDLDLQFGSLHLSFDMRPKSNLIEALNAVEKLDPVALEGFMTKHASGLRLLGPAPEQLALPWELSSTRLANLLQVAAKGYDQLVVDLPRQIDPLTTTVLEQADRVYVVMQQSLIHIRDTKRLLDILRADLGVAPERLHVLLNRYEARNATVSVKDIQESVNGVPITLIPNDYRRVSEVINLGVPLFEHAPNTPVAKALMEMLADLMGQAEKKPGRLRSVFANLLRA